MILLENFVVSNTDDLDQSAVSISLRVDNEEILKGSFVKNRANISSQKKKKKMPRELR